MRHGNRCIRDASAELVKMIAFRAAASEKRLLVREANRQKKSLSLLISEQIAPFLDRLRAREAVKEGVES